MDDQRDETSLELNLAVFHLDYETQFMKLQSLISSWREGFVLEYQLQQPWIRRLFHEVKERKSLYVIVFKINGLL